MNYEETCSQDSFTVRGSGFRFDYEAEKQLLNIAPRGKKRALAHFKFDQHLAKNPLAYVESLDKTNQIKALMYSNNATINLAETMDDARIASLIKMTAYISRCAFDLHTKNFDQFSKTLCQNFDLKSVKIKKITSRRKQNTFYLARIQTKHNNSISARSCTLSGLAASLSEKTLRDLITIEFGHAYGNSAQNLLNVSSKLSTISNILDQNFIPKQQLEHYKSLENHLNMAPIARENNQ